MLYSHFLNLGWAFLMIFIFLHKKTPFLTCTYFFIFLKCCLCWQFLVLKWKILDMVLSVLCRMWFLMSLPALFMGIQHKIIIPSTDSKPVYNLYIPLVCPWNTFQVFPSEEVMVWIGEPSEPYFQFCACFWTNRVKLKLLRQNNTFIFINKSRVWRLSNWISQHAKKNLTF